MSYKSDYVNLKWVSFKDLACHIAESVGAQAILAFTQTGSTAALVSKYRPRLPIFAVTPSQTVRRHMALYSGVHSIRVEIQGTTEAQIRSVEAAVLESGHLKSGDIVVITKEVPSPTRARPIFSRCTA